VDELVVITGYHRKSELRAPNRRPISADGEMASPSNRIGTIAAANGRR
jgi:hypothetical protein